MPGFSVLERDILCFATKGSFPWSMMFFGSRPLFLSYVSYSIIYIHVPLSSVDVSEDYFNIWGTWHSTLKSGSKDPGIAGVDCVAFLILKCAIQLWCHVTAGNLDRWHWTPVHKITNLIFPLEFTSRRTVLSSCTRRKQFAISIFIF